jgi:hypothetical protein
MSTEYTAPQVVTVLTGHVSPETAYTVADYPYGFRLRTSIRYWVETKKGQGQRFVSQTLNPKTGKWNAPKASTYSSIVGMFLDEQGHVQHKGLSGYSSDEQIDTFGREFAEMIAVDKHAYANYEYIQAAKRAASKVRWVVRPDDGTQRQTLEEQAELMHRLTIREMVNPGK